MTKIDIALEIVMIGVRMSTGALGIDDTTALETESHDETEIVPAMTIIESPSLGDEIIVKATPSDGRRGTRMDTEKKNVAGDHKIGTLSYSTRRSLHFFMAISHAPW